MKTSFMFLVCGCFLSMLIANSAFAQQQKNNMLPMVTITASKANLSEELVKAFEKTFEDARDAKWYQVNKNFLVKFIKDDQEQNALFKKDGALIYHVSYGLEKHLPAPIRNMVKAQYSQFQITRTFNVNQDSRDIWLINLENPQTVILTRVEDDELREVARYKNLSAPAPASLTDVKQ